MKNILSIILCGCLMQSCNNKKILYHTDVRLRHSIPGANTSQKIVGFWAVDTSENVDFVIDSKNEIFYPELNRSYKYSLSENSYYQDPLMTVAYDGFVEKFQVRILGIDTLQLISDTIYQYHRKKE